MNKNNSLSSQLDQSIIANNNAIEILTKLDEALNTNSNSVTAYITDINSNTVIEKNIPTIGSFKRDLDNLKSMFNTLIGIDGNGAVLATAKNEYKRIFLQDLNIEPNQISELNTVNNFKIDKNWFLDSMLDPLISVEFDLTGKIQDSIRKILSRRFILDFTNDNNALTYFDLNFKNKSNINIVDLVSWIDNNNIKYDIDEQVFDLTPGRLNYRGTFSVFSTENDTINNKFWFVLDTLNYLDVSNINNPIQKTLKIGDSLKVIPSNSNTTSTTVYTVDEISNTDSNVKVRLTRRTGNEPIPIRIAALSIESNVIGNKSVKISVGYNENCVVFVKPTSSVNNISSNNWSLGTGFLTADLKLDNTNTTLKNYYVTNVYDYSLILKDLVAKKVPTINGIKPNKPIINIDNFKAVQINKHLTDTVDSENLRNLHNKKNTLKSELDQINDAINTQQIILNTSVFKTLNDKKTIENEIANLNTKKENNTTQLNSIINEILANKSNVNSISPKYRLRGFWAMPQSIQDSNSYPQEVVQFEIYYRYANKNGSLSNVDTFKINDTTVIEAAFSQWIPIKTDARKRTYNTSTNQWVWEIEDVANADTPNINQLDISIEQNEQIQFKIRSISEVGWPDTLLYSDFSDIVTFTFPEDLSLILAEDKFLLNEASQDDMIIKFRKDLNASGLSDHLSKSFKEGDKYWPHPADEIPSGFRDNNGILIDLFTKLTQMQNEINSLNDKLSRAQGELRVTLFRNNVSIPIYNNDDLEYLINLEDYALKAQGGTVDAPLVLSNTRSYINAVSLLKEFNLKIDNASANNPLALIAGKNYNNNETPFSYNISKQATWLDNNSKLIFSKPNNNYITQLNNQFIWLQNKRSDNSDIYDHPNDEKTFYKVLNSQSNNIGISNLQTTVISDTNFSSITDKTKWNNYNLGYERGGMLSTLHPVIQDLKNIQELATDKVKIIDAGPKGEIKIPLNLYWKFSANNNMFSDKILDSTYFFNTTNTTATNAINNEDKKNIFLPTILQSLAISNITTGPTTTITFLKATGYTTVTSGTRLNASNANIAFGTVGGNILGPGLYITASGGEIISINDLTNITYNSLITIGTILTVTQSGASNGNIVITDISNPIVGQLTSIKFKPISLTTLKDMGLAVNDMIMFDTIADNRINNKYSKILSFSTSTNILTTNLNIGDVLSVNNQGQIALLTKVNTVKLNAAQVWNSIGRDVNTNKPINDSIFVLTDSLNRTISDNIKRTLRFYIEPENMGRSFQFSITLNIKQYNDTLVNNPATLTVVNNQTIN